MDEYLNEECTAYHHRFQGCVKRLPGEYINLVMGIRAIDGKTEMKKRDKMAT